MFSLQTTLE